MRRKYFFRARIHARSESRDWNTREISSLRLLLIQGYARLFVLVSLLLSPRARFFFFSLRNNGTIDIDIASRMRLRILGWNGTANDIPNNECETKREELGAFRNACTRTKSNLILSLVPWNRSSSKSDSFSDFFEFRSFVSLRIVGKYKGKRNGRGMAIELTRPSLAHTHIHRDILTRFPWHTNHVAVKEKERDKERGSEIVGPRRVTFKSTSADVGFLPVPRYPARLSARQFNEMFERHAKQ